MTGSERERGIWRAAITLANNICVQLSDRLNAADDVEAADAAKCCATRIREYAELDDAQLSELLVEAGINRPLMD